VITLKSLERGRLLAKTNGGFYDKNHIWNALKVFPFDNHVYRDRVETIIIRGNKDVFVKRKPDGEYFLPGGSKEKDIPDIVQAENECREEARIVISHIEPTGISLKHINEQNEDNYMWDGAVTDIYVAQYESMYKGKIKATDKDPFILSGKFYPVKQCLSFFKDEHREALIWYLKNYSGDGVVTESVYKDGLNKFIHNNIKTPEDLLSYMKSNIKYSNFDKLMSPEEVYEQKKGSCHDQSNFVFYVFNKLHLKKGRMFIIEVNDKTGQGGETHSFTYFIRKKNYYWFESAWDSNIGIHGPYNSISSMKKAVEDKWNKKKTYPTLYFSSVKGVKEGMSLQEFVDACLDDYTTESSTQRDAKVYFISDKNMNGETLQPKIPSNYFTQNGFEDNSTKRVCFSMSIDGALMGLSKNLKDKELYVHTPLENIDVYKPNTDEVPDCKITKEVWVKKPIKIKCIGKIKVNKASNKDGHKFTYGNDKSAELYEWDWDWDESFNTNKLSHDDTDDFTGLYMPQRIAEIRREIENKVDVTEAALSSKERNKLKDSDFGIPELRKYPLTDKAHVISAIRFFNQAPSKYEKELAINIFKAMKKYNVSRSVIGEKNKLNTYASVYLKNDDSYSETEISGFLSEYIKTMDSLISNSNKVLKFYFTHSNDTINKLKSSEDLRYINLYKNMMMTDFKVSIKLFDRLKNSKAKEPFEKKKNELYKLKYDMESTYKSSKAVDTKFSYIVNDDNNSTTGVINALGKSQYISAIMDTVIKPSIKNLETLLNK